MPCLHIAHRTARAPPPPPTPTPTHTPHPATSAQHFLTQNRERRRATDRALTRIQVPCAPPTQGPLRPGREHPNLPKALSLNSAVRMARDIRRPVPVRGDAPQGGKRRASVLRGSEGASGVPSLTKSSTRACAKGGRSGRLTGTASLVSHASCTCASLTCSHAHAYAPCTCVCPTHMRMPHAHAYAHAHSHAHAYAHAHAHASTCAQVEENRELWRSPYLLGGPTRRNFGLARPIDPDGGVSSGKPFYVGMGEGREAQEKKVCARSHPYPPRLALAPYPSAPLHSSTPCSIGCRAQHDGPQAGPRVGRAVVQGLRPRADQRVHQAYSAHCDCPDDYRLQNPCGDVATIPRACLQLGRC